MTLEMSQTIKDFINKKRKFYESFQFQISGFERIATYIQNIQNLIYIIELYLKSKKARTLLR